MDARRACYWWWFDSHTTSKGSIWLQSTLSELNEKTTSMLKLIEEDADSFAQRAEMYYQKRPELIAMVEDFYRAHRSLAERYDQLKHHPSTSHPRSPRRHSLPLSKDKYDDILVNSVKPFDSFTEMSYNSEESEIHDPEENYTRFDHHNIEENTENADGSCDDLMKLREELDRVREENVFQRNFIENKAKENEERIMNMKEELKRKEVQIKEAKRQFDEARQVSIEVKEAIEAENRRIKEALVEKDEEKREVIRQLSFAMEMLRQESRVSRKLIVKNSPKKFGNFGPLKVRLSGNVP